MDTRVFPVPPLCSATGDSNFSLKLWHERCQVICIPLTFKFMLWITFEGFGAFTFTSVKAVATLSDSLTVWCIKHTKMRKQEASRKVLWWILWNYPKMFHFGLTLCVRERLNYSKASPFRIPIYYFYIGGICLIFKMYFLRQLACA